MRHGKLSKGKKVEVGTTMIIAVVGLIGTAITAYLSYLSNTRPTELTIGATQTASSFTSKYVSPSSPVRFLPIQDKDLLIETFKLEGADARIYLRFIANNFDLDFDFSTPLNMECDALVYNITEHFALAKHIEVDMSDFPTGPYENSSWRRRWLPIINGEVIDPCLSQTLHDMAVKDGDLIGLVVKWELFTLTSGTDTIIIPTIPGATPMPTFTPFPTSTAEPLVRPPDLFP